MADEDEQVPPQLRELLRPTPSGTTKLIAAWKGLSAESQISLLLAKVNNPGPAYLYSDFIKSALESDNAYVRYLAARELRWRQLEDDDAVREALVKDSAPLVRYAHLELTGVLGALFDGDFNDPKKFFALPHEARLAKVREVNGNGERVANLISYGVKHLLKDKEVSEVELNEILSDYLIKPQLEKYAINPLSFVDDFGECQAGKDVESLWELVLEVPENISHVIVEHLPEAAGLSRSIPEHVLEGMSDRQKATLLDRADVGLPELRKKIFFERGEEEEDFAESWLRQAAIRFHFDLTNEEFAEILKKPDKARVRCLRDLAQITQDLRLCVYDAIHEELLDSDVSADDYEYAGYARMSLETKLDTLTGGRLEEELRQLKLYRLAVSTAKKGDSLEDQLTPILEERIIEGDVWATFMGTCEEWQTKHFLTKDLDKHLPRIWEADEEDNSWVEADESSALADKISEKLSKLLEPRDGEDRVSVLADAVERLSAEIASRQEKTLEAVNSIDAEMKRGPYQTAKSGFDIFFAYVGAFVHWISFGLVATGLFFGLLWALHAVWPELHQAGRSVLAGLLVALFGWILKDVLRSED